MAMGGLGAAESASVEDDVNAISDWTKEEKFALLQCLKFSGSHDIESIQTEIESKTPQQIQAAIKYYKAKAFIKRTAIKKKGGRPRSDAHLRPSLPLSNWAKFLTDSINYNDLQTEIATALRIIADYETIPQSACVDNVDFRKAYHLLANAVEGKALSNDKFVTSLIHKSIVETALTGKMFLKGGTVRQIVDHIKISNDKNDIKNFVRPTLNKELALIQHLSQQRNYNPMGIIEEHLKITE